ncbi:Uncharacterised protein [Legionella busanensis]|uniref:Uncharacterized protein n=1 Tax=Legionella busanensis TaxID=190655 RepID=A0A378JJW5_9GAMM|nr:hypothetical protein [Legionella busanensis]STX50450.1 Uncharacterised protein [Legionella busanensis]
MRSENVTCPILIRVSSFSISPINHKEHWRDVYDIKFKKLTIATPKRDMSGTLKFDKLLNAAKKYTISTALKCEGSIDFINGMNLTHQPLVVRNLLTVKGWLTQSTEQSLLPQSTFLVLSNTRETIFIKTHKMLRIDVGNYYKNRALDNSGYASFADVTKISGTYTLGLAFLEKDQIKICSKFNTLITFKGLF